MEKGSDKKPRQKKRKNVRTSDDRASYTNRMNELIREAIADMLFHQQDEELIKEDIADMLFQETKSTK